MKDINFPFLKHTGASLKGFSKGEAEVELHVKPYHLQHKGFVHGGVISTLMDNTGWYAAVSGLEDGFTAVTMEIKINYLKPALGKYLLASASIKRQGRTTSFVTIELHDEGSLIAYATGTYAIINDE
ncbi:PaaI family thioesterase [Psychromonas sp. SP041]|uniref:PaaI family thioesterase n=1 Tax=Psychromonas sp. SP041 TaxID=1365007 RepID=UPI0004205A8D|nr:PaaI family thioesterase [Psychromonas sp. SP041]